ncbi:inositol monophosphatase family protein [Streptococcus ruminantium]|uniref:Inositol monophosphatase family protein n=1 Tax=Streptococcus ruminantium TaxID=1917441 RepID=A0ABU1B688_9STRE|nr:inositol monophosphatase family protein [Streptococcus ruminantium]MDQ8758759.1 inositol monophosphatase family protein [Streptococcus ruminantium]MDQ8765722.1 inositol monophosphatase family protein [Streptococcus ruminantium]MDQ8767725.1 inositol monophosphatase family protein [Streptococcus ruminantium]MDQ8768518.1 inositol monophosphatase family protein [Streptococcus ruminantium]MDQ8775092.1 inositol monophosphatase family protein [Streptococcus ruminantium]
MEGKYQLAQSLVLEAGEFLRQHINDELQIEEKAGFTDLVTHLDRQVQEQLAHHIQSCYPQDRILGEEGKDILSVSEGNVWVIDPIDGTANFIAQKNDFAIMVAYFEDGVGQFGIIYDVIRDKLFHGGGVFPVYCNQKRLESPELRPLRQSLIGVNAQLYAANEHGVADLALQSLGTRSVGSAGIGFSHVFEGRLFAYASCLCLWDYAAASIIGHSLDLTMLSFEELDLSYGKREFVMLVSNAHLEEVKEYLF